MAFDSDTHAFHPGTGFMVDKRTGAPAGLLPVPPHHPDPTDFPKWVTPHASHIHRHDTKSGAPLHVSVPLFPNYHIGRDGAVTVLVDDEAYEKFALAEKGSMEPPAFDEPDMGHPGFVHHPASEGYPWGWWGPKDAMEPAAGPVLFGEVLSPAPAADDHASEAANMGLLAAAAKAQADMEAQNAGAHGGAIARKLDVPPPPIPPAPTPDHPGFGSGHPAPMVETQADVAAQEAQAKEREDFAAEMRRRGFDPTRASEK